MSIYCRGNERMFSLRLVEAGVEFGLDPLPCPCMVPLDPFTSFKGHESLKRTLFQGTIIDRDPCVAVLAKRSRTPKRSYDVLRPPHCHRHCRGLATADHVLRRPRSDPRRRPAKTDGLSRMVFPRTALHPQGRTYCNSSLAELGQT